MATKSIGMRLNMVERNLIIEAARRHPMRVTAWCRERLERMWNVEKDNLEDEFPKLRCGFGTSFTITVPEETCEKYRKLAHAEGVSLARWARTRLVQIAMLEKLKITK